MAPWPWGGDPAQLLSDLTQGKISPQTKVHLDPDLDPASLERHPDWKPSFGQARASERHLRNQGVGSTNFPANSSAAAAPQP
ncbi:MAG: hypothetical protein HC824_09105 [Synechococcales cyanobacterium RM1_1_8]|nr:hypothetical protein [Synechococcales cyanobacterium RM1_1_8]